MRTFFIIIIFFSSTGILEKVTFLTFLSSDHLTDRSLVVCVHTERIFN